MAIDLTIETGGVTYHLFEEDEYGRIAIGSSQSVEKPHALYEPIKNLMQCINEYRASISDFQDEVNGLATVTDGSD